MKILTDLKTKVEGDVVTITAKLLDGPIPAHAYQHTALHFDNIQKGHISHIQMSNHGFFVRRPNSQIGVALPSELWVSNVARVIEPQLNPPAKPDVKPI